MERGNSEYRGRIAPSPTGYLHLGHMATFGVAWGRAEGGVLVLRNEDLDKERSREEYVAAMLEDLEWMGIGWDEGPVRQSDRGGLYLEAWKSLKAKGLIYPCERSRKDLEGISIYPTEWRGDAGDVEEPGITNWRFRVPYGRKVEFADGHYGDQSYTAGENFGDFVIWRREGQGASYELAVVVDDHDMGITEVVRGADLLEGTAKQILLYEALGWELPAFYHCKLICDEGGKRLGKRHDSLSIRELREQGLSLDEVKGMME